MAIRPDPLFIPMEPNGLFLHGALTEAGDVKEFRLDAQGRVICVLRPESRKVTWAGGGRGLLHGLFQAGTACNEYEVAYAIVELEDGSVQQVPATWITFEQPHEA